jgi:hypothetical protein
MKTADGGSLWENDPPGTNELLTAVQFTSATSGFIIGNNKTIFRYTLISGEEETGRPGDREMELVKVWPNPTRGELKVQRAKGKVEFESLELIDIYGKRLELWNPGTPGTSGTSGTWNQKLDISPLPSGIYFIRISFENQIIVKRIIKV